ncbi:hypothetical protein HDU76_006661 [Blyttiomyces sp. JEL0837]|nr:hypothetical protein HDU76_006661 [Blyttiomyces sp. JEL0837]
MDSITASSRGHYEILGDDSEDVIPLQDLSSKNPLHQRNSSHHHDQEFFNASSSGDVLIQHDGKGHGHGHDDGIGRSMSGHSVNANHTVRDLQSRHLTMIALGGTIGTGLFLASGSVIASAGPLGALLAYTIVGLMVWGVVTSLGEMSTLIPTSGAFGELSYRYVSPALGFTVGWNYWVRGFGETEYWLSFIKVLAIIIFIIVAFAVVCGASHLGPLGFRNWSSDIKGAPIGESEAVNGSVDFKRFIAVLGAFPTAFYSYGGTDADLSNTRDIRVAPFTRVYNLVGIKYADHIMNAVILVAVLSAANSSIYACSRTLMGLAERGMAPKICTYVNERGTPVVALLISLGFGSMAFLGTLFGDGNLFAMLVNVLSLATMFSWICICITHLRFRWGWIAQGRSVSDLPYVAPFFPYADYLSLLIGAFVVAGLAVSASLSPFDVIDDAPLYGMCAETLCFFSTGIPLIFLLYFAYVAAAYFRIGNATYTGLVPYTEMDFDTGRMLDDDGKDEIDSNRSLLALVTETLA